jgi:hypothetical protein
MRDNRSRLTRRLGAVLAPLGKREAGRAIRVATDHLLRELGSGEEGRFRIIGAELKIEKPPRRGATPKRLIQVFIVDYANPRNLGVIIDSRGRMLESRALTFQPTFADDEISEARAIAERDARVSAIAKRRRTSVNTFTPREAAERGHRIIGLRYFASRRQARAQIAATVVVDLNEGRLVSFRGAQTQSNANSPAKQQEGELHGGLG